MMKSRIPFSAFVLTLSLLAASGDSGYALGFRLINQDAAATARGNAFVATADNPSAVYYNPAGLLGQDGLTVSLGAYGISLESSFTAEGGGSGDSKYSPQAVPAAYLAWHTPGSRIGLGFGIYAPFGLGVEYDNHVPFRTAGTKAAIQFITFSPVVAVQLTDSLSVAGGAAVNYSRAKFGAGIVTPGDEFLIEGEGTSYGFIAGVMWAPAKEHHFGLTYHSATSMEYSGHARTRIPGFTVPTPFGPFPVPRLEREEDMNVGLDYPQVIAGGYSFRPTPDWNFEFNVEWTDWSALNTPNIHKPSGPTPLRFEYESSYVWDFGVTRQLGHGFYASAGYTYAEVTVPSASFNPVVPDVQHHTFGVGVGRRSDRFSWDITYQYSHGPARGIDVGGVADGTYRFESHAVQLGLAYRF